MSWAGTCSAFVKVILDFFFFFLYENDDHRSLFFKIVSHQAMACEKYEYILCVLVCNNDENEKEKKMNESKL